MAATPQAQLEKELQSTLLRISIICATSIQSLRESSRANVIEADAPLPPLSSQLSAQIVNDLTQLLTLAQKHTNALSLALRPSKKQSVQPAFDNFSPVSGLDAESLEAAKAQIVALGSDILPKMVFLAKKAHKDSQIFQIDPKLAAQQKKNQSAERQKLEQLAKEMGGKVMTSDQLGMSSDDVAMSSSNKLVDRSLGTAFAREIRSAVQDVLSSMAELLQSFLDTKTKGALLAAQNSRDKADGITAGTDVADSSDAAPKTVQEARQRSLELNNRVWETCIKYIGKRSEDGTPTTLVSISPSGSKVKVQVKGLSKDNLEASKKVWKERVETMRDGLNEMKEAVEAGLQDPAAAKDDFEDLGEVLSAAPSLTPEEHKRLGQLTNLVKEGNALHENVLKAILTSKNESPLDLDMVEELAKDLEEAQDELVAAGLYGEVDAGLDEVDENDESVEEEDLTEEASVPQAVLRTLQQYARAAVSLSAYVSGNEEQLDQVDTLESSKDVGAFEQTFETRFTKLSQIVTASSNVQDRKSTATANGHANGAATKQTPTITSVPRQANDEFKTEVFVQELQNLAQQLGQDVKIADRAIAEQLDKTDPLAPMRDGYILPKMGDVCKGEHADKGAENSPDATALYMCGNSLGPLSKLSKQFLQDELDAWGRKAVLGHFDHPYERPWTQMEKRVGELMADIVGAKQSEVVVMGTLTGNLHTMLATFYRPAVKPFGVFYKGSIEEGKKAGLKVRHKIVYELKAFPSDKYAIDSVIELNGFDPATSLVPLSPKEGTRVLETADILAKIDEVGKEGETNMIMLGGLQYFTGQYFDIEKIAAKAREHDILFGVDFAHGFANVPMKLHDWNVDFAVWCTYKYGSSGPGGIAGLFVHERWTDGTTHEMLTRPAGWWGHDRSTRFSMPEQFKPIEGAEGWQASNPSMLDITTLRGSLETLNKATELVTPPSVRPNQVGAGKIMPILRSKSLRLTAYLESLLTHPGFLPEGLGIKIVTPTDPLQRGSQLCIQIPDLRNVAKEKPAAKVKGVPPPIQSTRLIARAHTRAETQRGLVADIRHPDMLRIAPLAQFSTFTEVWRTAEALRLSVLEELELENQ